MADSLAWTLSCPICSVQFIQLHQIHYKSKMPIGYRISCSTIHTDSYDKDSIHKVTIIIRAGNKMCLIYDYLTDRFI